MSTKQKPKTQFAYWHPEGYFMLYDSAADAVREAQGDDAMPDGPQRIYRLVPKTLGTFRIKETVERVRVKRSKKK